MWRFIGASVMGAAHQSTNTACQDCCHVEQIQIAQQQYLLALVADGAGSALQGGQGAALACYALAKSIKSQLVANQPFEQLLIHQALVSARVLLQQQAQANGLELRDYASTMLGIVIAPQQAIAFQIGDGAIVASVNHYQGVVFWPDNGLYANMTYFLTDDDYRQHLNLQTIDATLQEVMLFSDGLQRLALSFDAKTPHEPFFAPILKALRANNANTELLNQHLAQFLASDMINKRTDDDKTLVLATRTA